MISPTAIERSAAWRPWVLASVVLLGLVPGLTLAWRGLGGSDGFSVGDGFVPALWNSAFVAAAVAGAGLLVGLPLGVLAGLYSFPGRSVMLAVAALPLLVPSFLWAIGWSAIAARTGGVLPALLSGRTGCIIVFLCAAVPLVTLTALAATTGLSASQVEAARLAGGERSVVRQALGAATPLTLAAACLASVLTLSDPGPGQILSLRTASSEFLTSFAALYDFDLAARQCLALTGIVLAVTLPLATVAGPRLADQLLSRQTRPHRPAPVARRHRLLLVILFLLLISCSVGLPLAGLVMPLREAADLSRATERLWETVIDTLVYGIGAAALAVAAAVLLSAAAGRSRRLAIAAVAGCIVIFAQPPALVGLGFLRLGTDAPEAADPVLRGRAIVVAALAVRLFPVAAVLGLRQWAAMPASWAAAAAVHGVGLGRYTRRILLPHLLPALGLGAVLVALLSTADVSTVLLLHPPGQPSMPLAVFTVMANAPESLVAAMCIVYIAAAAGVLWTVLWLARRWT